MGIGRWIGGAFFLSGFAALVYQVVWQRSLFAIFGINSESVTLVVTAFMLGLGVGSVVGGMLSRTPGTRLLLYFGLAEMGIGAFGAISLQLFTGVGAFTMQAPRFITGSTIFGLLLAPTMLMGGTLPLLVGYAVRRSGNVGQSVSTLYFVNTLGSSLAAVVSALVLLRVLGEHRSVLVAVMINLVVGCMALAHYRRSARQS